MKHVPYVIRSAVEMPIKKRRRIHWASFLLGLVTGVALSTAALLVAGAI